MNNDVVIYQSSDGLVKMEAIVDASNETIWATQKAMAQLFGVNVPAISKHLKNIYSEGELVESMTISKMETVVQRGFRGAVREMVEFYNLDAIISVGYRVNSIRGVQFRMWATSVLREYLIKGFAMNDALHTGNLGEITIFSGLLFAFGTPREFLYHFAEVYGKIALSLRPGYGTVRLQRNMEGVVPHSYQPRDGAADRDDRHRLPRKGRRA